MKNRKGAYAPVFYPSIILAALFSLIAIIFPNSTADYMNKTLSFILSRFGWLYILAMSVFMCLCIFLMISRFGNIKLGQSHETPEYSDISWFAMLFAAGMGIGLMFYGVAEPLHHFIAPPNGTINTQLEQEAINITFFHWGIQAWSVYAIVGLSLAYFSYRHDLPLLPRSILYPFIGKRIYGLTGHLIDIFAILGTLFGVATSLGFGAIQVSSGINFLTHIGDTPTMQVIYIIAIVALATISVGLGLDKGIKTLSNINIILALILLVFILALGHTSDLVKDYVQNIGYYLSTIVNKTFNLYAYNKSNQQWLNSWTLFYWGWWMAWSPFVGMFIAKVSKGRTIRQFIVGVLFIPTGFTFLWMTIFGNSAISIVNNGGSQLADAAINNIPTALFQFLNYFPFPTFSTILVIILIVTFFVTSADSGALVIDTLATADAKESSSIQRMAWSVLVGLIAIALLLAGGLKALQSATIISAFPLIFTIFLMIIALIKALRLDYLKLKSIETHSTVVQYVKANTQWQDRLKAIVDKTTKKQAINFLSEIAKPAILEISTEMKNINLETSVCIKDEMVSLIIYKEGVEDFTYTVQLRVYDDSTDNDDKYSRIEVFLGHGGQYYDIIGYTKEQVIADIVNQYDKHLHYLHLANADKSIT